VKRTRLVRRLVPTLAFALGVLSVPSQSRALPPLHGAVDGRMLLGVSSRYGGALGVDLWLGEGKVRGGIALGVGALSKDSEASSRVFTPMALSLALVPPEDKHGPTAILRAGGYAGAQKGGLIGGPLLSAALGYRVTLGEGASVRFGADALWLFGHHAGLFLGPYVGLGF
jgi:hypothetical protein